MKKSFFLFLSSIGDVYGGSTCWVYPEQPIDLVLLSSTSPMLWHGLVDIFKEMILITISAVRHLLS
jgi:hypothetical protein